MKWCSSASLGGARAARIDHHAPCRRAARMRAQPAGHVGRGQQAAVRDERVGAEDEQVVGAVDVGHRHAEHGAEHQPGRRPASASGRRCWPSRRCACRARAAAPGCRAPSARLCASGCRGRRRPRRGRARARIGGRRALDLGERLVPADAGTSAPSRRISGVRRRSGSASSSFSA